MCNVLDWTRLDWEPRLKGDLAGNESTFIELVIRTIGMGPSLFFPLNVEWNILVKLLLGSSHTKKSDTLINVDECYLLVTLLYRVSTNLLINVNIMEFGNTPRL